ncbi:MAG: response regulator [Candidatus Sumerlaeia bacterium]
MDILIVDDEPAALEYLALLAGRADHNVRTALDGDTALRAFREMRPDLILTDLQMPGLSGLELLEIIRREDSRVIVIIITGHGSERNAAEALRLGANDYINKPVRPRQLEALLNKYDGIVKAHQLARQIPDMVVERTLTIRFENRVELVPEVAEFLVNETRNLLSEEDRLGVHLGLNELLMNAVEHGNLQISAEEKTAAMSESQQGLIQLYQSRLSDPLLATRRVTVQFTAGNGRCEWIISDEGEGFDYNRLADPTRTDGLASLTGRGIYLSRFQFDEVEFLGRGNKVRACKYIKSQSHEQTWSGSGL